MKHIANIISYMNDNSIIAYVYEDDKQTGEFKIQSSSSSEGYWFKTLEQLKEELEYIPFVEVWNRVQGMKDAIYDEIKK